MVGNGDSARIRKLIDRLPHETGWQSESARATFRAQGVFLLGQGLTVNQVFNILSDLYEAAMLELTS